MPCAPFLFTLASLVTQSQTIQPVALTYTDAKATKVEFAGDLYGWDTPQALTNSGGKWIMPLNLPTDARFEYKFIVDDKWILDPNAPKMDNSLGDFNSVYQGPDYHPAFDEDPPKTPLIRTVIKVKGRDIVIFAPANSHDLPVLAYGDGPGYETYGKVQNVVENLVEAGKIKPVVIALVPPTDRMKEYGSDWRGYASYLLDDVIPAVRQATHASSKPQDLYIGGSSLGGSIAFRLAEEYPKKFAGGVHGQSSAFQYRPAGVDYPDLIKPENLRKIAKSTKIWLDWGNFEDGLTTSNQQAIVTLKVMKRPFDFAVTNEGHNWTAWRNRMVAGLTYLLGDAKK